MREIFFSGKKNGKRSFWTQHIYLSLVCILLRAVRGKVSLITLSISRVDCIAGRLGWAGYSSGAFLTASDFTRRNISGYEKHSVINIPPPRCKSELVCLVSGIIKIPFLIATCLFHVQFTLTSANNLEEPTD